MLYSPRSFSRLTGAFCFSSGSQIGHSPPSTPYLSMNISPLRVNGVVYGVGGAFNQCLGKITKVNPSKPAVEDGTGRCSCYWRENLKRVGSVTSRFGKCSVCKRPGEFDKPCAFNGVGSKGCQGIIRGNYDWRMKSQTPSEVKTTAATGQQSMGIFLAKQLGAALFRLGFSEVTADVIDSVKHGLREASTARRGVSLDPRSVSPSASLLDSKVS